MTRLALPLFCSLAICLAQTTPASLIAEGQKLTGAAAIAKFQQALEAARTINDKPNEARALTRLGQTYLQMEQYAEGLRNLESALPVWRAAGDRFQEALTVHNIATAQWLQGEPTDAIPKFEAALQIRRDINDKIGQIYTLRGISNCYWTMGEAAQALDLSRQALALALETKEPAREADARNALGLLYALLGDATRARAEFAQSYAIFQKLGDPVQAAIAQNNLGWTAIGLRQYDQALEHLTPALAALEKAGSRQGMAYALQNIGNAQAGRKQYAAAIPNFERSLKLKQDLGDRWAANYTLHALGETYLAQGDTQRGIAMLTQALEGRRTLQDRTGLILTLGSLAHAHRATNDLKTAEAEIREAIAAIELSRANLVSQDLRASYLASKRDFYEFLIDLLASQNRKDEALEIAEQSRGRLLVDRLGDVLAQVRDTSNTQQERAATQRVNALAARLERLGATPGVKPATEAKLRQDLEAALAAARDAAEQVRKQSPRYASLAEPPKLSATAIQKLLAPGDVLIAYSLGTNRSYSWTVTTRAIGLQTLPSRAKIESAIAALSRSITTRDPNWQSHAANLEAALQLRAIPGWRRLIVAAEGPVETVPFAALPALRNSPVDVAYLPSAAALELQRTTPSQPRPQDSILVLADPAFEQDLPRLRFSRLEADSIAALAPQRTQKALDRDASRRLLLDSSVRNHSILHLATHAIVNPQYPELSRVALSAFDSRGNHLEPSLRLHEIYKLNLRARLVTLSACRTATGSTLPGEGLISLTRGFQYAGARSVLATLWDVEDRSTTQWMAAFYKALLVRKQSMSTAVRSAVDAIRANPEWSHPYYWAGFVLQGEWR
ncbi:hypothetical protein F183_A02440 [Bryobacterales bacterium F-183]|nr:hypothetical protein F183_A02440 [Bryobacterales bacterium F-183]